MSQPSKVHFALDKEKLSEEDRAAAADLLSKEARRRKLAGSRGKMSLEKATSVIEANKSSKPRKGSVRQREKHKKTEGTEAGTSDEDEESEEDEGLVRKKELTIPASAFEKRRKLNLPTKNNVVKAKTVPCPHQKIRPWALAAEQRANTFRQENGFSRHLAVPKYRMPGWSIDGHHSGTQHN